jgi:hypothetical protein
MSENIIYIRHPEALCSDFDVNARSPYLRGEDTVSKGWAPDTPKISTKTNFGGVYAEEFFLAAEFS